MEVVIHPNPQPKQAALMSPMRYQRVEAILSSEPFFAPYLSDKPVVVKAVNNVLCFSLLTHHIVAQYAHAGHDAYKATKVNILVVGNKLIKMPDWPVIQELPARESANPKPQKIQTMTANSPFEWLTSRKQNLLQEINRLKAEIAKTEQQFNDCELALVAIQTGNAPKPPAPAAVDRPVVELGPAVDLAPVIAPALTLPQLVSGPQLVNVPQLVNLPLDQKIKTLVMAILGYEIQPDGTVSMNYPAKGKISVKELKDRLHAGFETCQFLTHLIACAPGAMRILHYRPRHSGYVLSFNTRLIFSASKAQLKAGTITCIEEVADAYASLFLPATMPHELARKPRPTAERLRFLAKEIASHLPEAHVEQAITLFSDSHYWLPRNRTP
jgi:hypothetical protein